MERMAIENLLAENFNRSYGAGAWWFVCRLWKYVKKVKRDYYLPA
jgi:hypothetical protein